MLNPSDENNVIEEVTMGKLLKDITEAPDENDTGSYTDHNEELETEDIYSIDDQLKSLAIAKATSERHNILNEACLQVFLAYQRELRLERKAKLTQKSIYDYCGKK